MQVSNIINSEGLFSITVDRRAAAQESWLKLLLHTISRRFISICSNNAQKVILFVLVFHTVIYNRVYRFRCQFMMCQLSSMGVGENSG